MIRSSTLSVISASRPVTSGMFVGALTLLGVIASAQIPVALLPASTFPGLTIEVEYSGVGPEKIEELLTIPLEEAVSTVGGIEQLSSVSEEGKSRVDLEFTRGTDVDLKALEVRERVDLAAAVFPREVQNPVMLRYDPDKRPVRIVVLENTSGDLTETREIADREIKQALEGARGASDVIVAGGKQREILVSCDKDRLHSFGLSMQDMLSALQKANVSRTLGRVEHNGGRYSLTAPGRFQDLEEIRDLTVETADNGHRISVRDTSVVTSDFRDEDTASRFNGEERVSLYIHKAGDANLMELSRDVHAILDALPRNRFQARVVYDQADLIRTALRNLAIACVAGTLLAGTGIYLTFGVLRLTSFTLITLPVAFFIASFLLYLARFEYNLITTSGFLLGAGISMFLILTTVSGVRRHGPTGAGRTIGPVLRTGTLLLAAIFVPVVFAGEELRATYGGLALAVLAPIWVTLMLCMTALPLFLRRQTAARIRFPARFQNRADVLRGRTARWRVRLDSFFVHTLGGWIRAALLWIFARPYPALGIGAGLMLAAACAFGFSRHALTAASNARELNISIEFPSGTSFGPTNSISKEVEKKLIEQPGVREITSRVEAGKATLRVKLDEDVRATTEYLDTLKKNVGKHEPAFIYIGADTEAGALREITVDVLGEDLAKLDEITKKMAGGAKSYDGVSDVVLRYKAPRPEMILRMDRVKAERAGLTVSEAGQNIRFAIQGGVATKFQEPTRELDIRIRYDEKFRNRLKDLAGFFLKAQDGRFVPALEISRLEKGRVPVKIYRKNKKRSFSFSLQTGDADFGTISRELDRLRAMDLPENYRVEFGREFQQAVEARNRFIFVIALCAVLVYMILASHYESLTRPALLLVCVPPPLLAAILALFVLRIPFTLPVYIGFLILSGFVALQVLLYEHALALNEARPDPTRALYDRLRDRLDRLAPALPEFARAGLIVALFLLPFALVFGPSGDYLRGIALTVCIGLVVSTLTTPAAAALVATLAAGPEVSRWFASLRTQLGQLIRRRES